MDRLIRRLTLAVTLTLALAIVLAVPAAGTAAVRDVAPGELRAALAAAATGDTLRLLPGVHPGPVVVEVGVRILGEPGAVVEGPGTGTVIAVLADAVEISGLTVRGGGADLSSDDAVIRFDRVHHGVVSGCRVEARGFGIYLKAGGNHRVEGNEVVGERTMAVARRGNGIHLWHTEHNQIADNHTTFVRDGVYLSFAHDNVIRGNRGEGLRYGIHYMYSERNTLVQNRFERSTGAIALMFSFDNHIEGNVATRSERFGILCQQVERSVLVGNRVEGNGRGFYLENSAANRFADNSMIGNGVGVFLTAGSERNTFTGNQFDGNLVQVHRDHAGRNSWWEGERGNAWSDYAGFDWNDDGVGDTPYRLETASSALLARHPGAGFLWMSPLLALLDWWDGQWAAPAADAFDVHPLTRVPVAVVAAVSGEARP